MKSKYDTKPILHVTLGTYPPYAALFSVTSSDSILPCILHDQRKAIIMFSIKHLFDRLVHRKDNSTIPTKSFETYHELANFFVRHLPDEERTLLHVRCRIEGKGQMRVRWCEDQGRTKAGTRFNATKRVVRSLRDTDEAHQTICEALQDPHEKYQIGPYELVWKGVPVESVFDRYTIIGSLMAASDARVSDK